MTIKELKIEELREYENNPRLNGGAVGAVAASIKEFGFKVPIVVDKDNVIVAGHTRLKAAQQIGLETVPCIVADDLTPEQAAAFRLADNKVAEFADWDFNKLEAELFDISLYSDIDMSQFGFETEKINSDDFDDNFSLSDSDIPQKRTITLTLCPKQYEIAEKVIESLQDHIEHDFGNENAKSNAFFEAVYIWADRNNFVD